jgi:flagellar protein FliJ
MASFAFRLQPLLDLRQRAEDEARCALATAERQLLQQRRELADLHEACEEAREDASVPAGGTVSPGLLLNNGLYLSRLRLLTVVHEEGVERSAQDEQAQREQAVERARARRVLEQLKEQRHERHLSHEALRERRVQEEIATLGYALKRAGTGERASS